MTSELTGDDFENTRTGGWAEVVSLVVFVGRADADVGALRGRLSVALFGAAVLLKGFVSNCVFSIVVL